MAETLERLASAYDLEVEIATRRLMAALEPALTLAMAAVVGFIALALMTTILELSHI
ncbi:MAG TPA: type II secretion system F family protein [Candidatus Brocadiia bacterium]|nr:type II secretion system F family protein [Candidatus Brocadiia bacterium]